MIRLTHGLIQELTEGHALAYLKYVTVATRDPPDCVSGVLKLWPARESLIGWFTCVNFV